MDNIFVDKTQVTSSSSNAFLIYRPQSTVTEEMVFYNKEAWRILSLSDRSPKKGGPSHPEICSICSNWRELLEKRSVDPVESIQGEDSEVYFIELIKSCRRLYSVRGLLLSGHQHSLQKRETHFMFILERICPDRVNLPLISRQWNLNNREQDVVRLLLEERSNKEIAHFLGLSLNTVKGYMKLLMRKLGVTAERVLLLAFLPKKVQSSPHYQKIQRFRGFL
jgi:DNA-binding CsgD family transcriptional regulator